MSKIQNNYEIYLNTLAREEMCRVKPIIIDKRKLTEQQRCRIFGEACEYGICDECELAERR